MSNVLPNHVAIILDGNGRWAKKRLMPRTFGHKVGSDNLVELAKYCNRIGLKNLTVFCFSTENWSRPSDEVKFLMALLKDVFERIFKKMDEGIKIKVVGEKENLSQDILDIIEKVENKTKDNTGLNLNIAFNYGSRDEIIHAVKEMVENKEEITKENLSKHLYVGDVDLLIRTSGEERISNFLLWQISYSELYFTDVYWPDFNSKEFDKAIEAYNKRNRRFGGLNK
ncbi:MAG: di-trans,poly-cis-decaprenylcistransferase [Bacilli bacterium]|nr:di-trans,poly-cis-decaprenylcistransferase [Bacilli bacterium]